MNGRPIVSVVIDSRYAGGQLILSQRVDMSEAQLEELCKAIRRVASDVQAESKRQVEGGVTE